MAVYHDARCRLCRREGVKLMLKGERCLTDKCGVDRRAYPPGEHGRGRRRKQSEYLTQLREKQKARRIYGVLERQFRNYFHKAEKSKGVTGETLLQMLEMRVDNILYRLGLAPSRSASRQIVRHGHVTVNGKKVSIPSYVTRPGDVVAIRAKSRDLGVIAGTLEKRKGQSVPEWLELDSQARTGRVLMAPSRQSIPVPVTEQLIVELYSK